MLIGRERARSMRVVVKIFLGDVVRGEPPLSEMTRVSWTRPRRSSDRSPTALLLQQHSEYLYTLRLRRALLQVAPEGVAELIDLEHRHPACTYGE